MHNATVSLEVEYLGPALDKRLTWPTHFKRKNSRRHLLKPLLGTNISFNLKLFCFLFPILYP